MALQSLVNNECCMHQVPMSPSLCVLHGIMSTPSRLWSAQGCSSWIWTFSNEGLGDGQVLHHVHVGTLTGEGQKRPSLGGSTGASWHIPQCQLDLQKICIVGSCCPQYAGQQCQLQRECYEIVMLAFQPERVGLKNCFLCTNSA